MPPLLKPGTMADQVEHGFWGNPDVDHVLKSVPVDDDPKFQDNLDG